MECICREHLGREPRCAKGVLQEEPEMCRSSVRHCANKVESVFEVPVDQSALSHYFEDPQRHPRLWLLLHGIELSCGSRGPLQSVIIQGQISEELAGPIEQVIPRGPLEIRMLNRS